MRIALYEPDIPQNTGTILRHAACLGVEARRVGKRPRRVTHRLSFPRRRREGLHHLRAHLSRSRRSDYAVGYNPQHDWYWFPRMRRDEALVFKVFDSAKDGRARWTAHTAFDDPTTPPNARPRESIEIRTLAFL